MTQQSTRFNPIRPIFFMHTPDITQEEKDLAIEALREVLDIANVNRQIPITDFGVWREPNWIDADGNLVPHMSVDWYVDKWWNSQRGQVNSDQTIRQLWFDPWNEKQPHYDVILTAKDLYIEKADNAFVVGSAAPTRATIISVVRFRQIADRRMERETKKQETYHEIGHVFGLPDERRGFDIEYSLGPHCTNLCAVRQGLTVPRDWIKFVYDRHETGQIYCDPCIKDLRQYFHNR